MSRRKPRAQVSKRHREEVEARRILAFESHSRNGDSFVSQVHLVKTQCLCLDCLLRN